MNKQPGYLKYARVKEALGRDRGLLDEFELRTIQSFFSEELRGGFRRTRDTNRSVTINGAGRQEEMLTNFPLPNVICNSRNSKRACSVPSTPIRIIRSC